MANYPLIRKASGEKEPFSQEKFKNSLKRSGADNELIERILDKILPWLREEMPTKEIYRKAFSLLRSEKRSLAARYSLKKAIMELGPEGYPFEQFIAFLLMLFGYKTKTGIYVQGHCVQHEVDVLAEKKQLQCFIECKYFNSQDKYANVQVPLYIQSRFLDIVKQRKSMSEFSGCRFEGWIVTNTRFTSDALEFGYCVGLNMLSWNYPQAGSLKDMVEQKAAYPVTALTQLNRAQKKQFLREGIVACLQLREDYTLLNKLDITDIKRKRIIEELEDLLSALPAQVN